MSGLLRIVLGDYPDVHPCGLPGVRSALFDAEADEQFEITVDAPRWDADPEALRRRILEATLRMSRKPLPNSPPHGSQPSSVLKRLGS